MLSLKRYPGLLTQKEIIRLLHSGVYRVDENTGNVYGQNGKQLVPFEDDNGYQFVRLYSNCKRKAITIGKLVWMAKTKQPIPPQFEVHHRNEIKSDNSWQNLVCLHKMDHAKLHSDVDLADIPF